MGTFTISQTKDSLDLVVYPISDLSSCTDWTPIGDAPNYTCIDDHIYHEDEDATYTKWQDTVLGLDMYRLPNNTAIPDTINYIRIYARAKTHAFPPYPDGTFKIVCSPTSECSLVHKSENKSLSTSYQLFSYQLLKNPETETTWTLADLNNLSIGVEASGEGLGFGADINEEEADAAGAINTHDTESGAPSGDNYTHINSVNDSTYISTGNGWKSDIYNFTESGTYPSNYIEKVVIKARCKAKHVDSNIIGHLHIGGVYYSNSNEYDHPEGIPNVWTNYTFTWEKNPATGGRWTTAAMKDLQFGIMLYLKHYSIYPGLARCSHCSLDIYHGYSTPEVRATQVFAIVNYTPPTDDCTLNKPEEISVDHNRNTKMLNFWDGTREVYDLKRSSKTTVLTGSEYYSGAYNRIACIRAMGKNGSTIVISDLSFNLYNGDYKIRSFGWKHVSQKPEYYEWILELESTT